MVFDLQSYTFFFICLFLLVACIGKSAQIGLHIWLPEAMEGPTPVSSLIHAATMVTAGIFLVIKTSFLYTSDVYPYILMIGGITAFFASSIGAFQNDLKKIIAYSTCSQLGYMLLACGLGGFNNSFFHLYTHAFFKALLFLTAGYVIHAVTDDQDMRKMGSLAFFLPLCYVMILYGSILLMGFPMTSGFFSKESIILIFNQIIFKEHYFFFYNFFIFFEWFIYISLLFTVWYSMKLLFLVFYFKNNHSRYYLYTKNNFVLSHSIFSRVHSLFVFFKHKKNTPKLHYSNYTMWVALIELGDLSMYQGYLTKEMFIGVHSDFFQGYISNFFSDYIIYPVSFSEYGSENALFISTYFLFIFFFIYFFFYNFCYYQSVKSFFVFINRHLSEQYLFFSTCIINPFLKKGLSFSYNFSFLVIEKGIVEWSGPFFLSNIISRVSFFFFKKAPHFANLFIGYLFLFLCIFFILLV
jgi:NADH-ubiquinone oxidoreductase chain 5